MRAQRGNPGPLAERTIFVYAGLPVLASINPGNDLAGIIGSERIGRVCTDHSVDTLLRLAEDLMLEIGTDTNLPARCRALAKRFFPPEAAVKQIAAALVR